MTETGERGSLNRGRKTGEHILSDRVKANRPSHLLLRYTPERNWIILPRLSKRKSTVTEVFGVKYRLPESGKSPTPSQTTLESGHAIPHDLNPLPSPDFSRRY